MLMPERHVGHNQTPPPYMMCSELNILFKFQKENDEWQARFKNEL